MNIELDEQIGEFPIPPELRQVLETHVREYGTGGGVGKLLPGTRAWIARDGSEVLGYAWITTATLADGETATYFSQAVLPSARRQGVSAVVRSRVEEILRTCGIATLWVQVNNRDPSFGLGVRLRLLLTGYVVDRSRVEQRYLGKSEPSVLGLSDEALARAYILPLHFKKALL